MVTQKLQLPWFYLMLFLFNLVPISSIDTASSQISYHDYCNSIVPESTVTGTEPEMFRGNFLQLQNGYYIGGDRFLGQESQSSPGNPRYMYFYATNVYQTDAAGVLMVEGNLGFQGSKAYSDSVNSTYNGRLRHRTRWFHLRQGGANFNLQGFWSASTGKLCMVGSGMSYSEEEGKSLKLSAVFKLNYPEKSTILTCLVGGTLESLDMVDSSNYFEPISILAYSQSKYDYSVINDEINNGWSSSPSGVQQELSLGLPSRVDICSVLSSPTTFELEYRRDCDPAAAAANCHLLDNSNGFLPGTMFLEGLRCSNNQKMRLAMVFTNDSYYGFNHPFNPKTSLVGEGVWDAKMNQLYIVACRILNFADSLGGASVGNCSIRMNLRFPAVLSIRNRTTVVGQIWSNATANTSSGYFDALSFHAKGRSPVVPGLKYDYTMMGETRKLCDSKAAKSNGKIYPDGYSYDMVFHMSVKNDLGQIEWGSATPQTIGDQFHEYSRRYFTVKSDPVGDAAEVSTHNHSNLLNVSYQMTFTISQDFKLGRIPLNAGTTVQISAEGIYNDETGGLCMVGCLSLDSKRNTSAKNDSLDCKIVINVQFHPLDASYGTQVKGTIKSTREKSDPLYFKSLEVLLNVVYYKQAEEYLWRMDLEIIMVLISNTLACVFIGVQLFYVKKHPDMALFISLVMLFILTLGHMIPLLLNFEALFMEGRDTQNILLGNGGWLQVNEVIVRVVTMVAFLLQFRLLQQVWAARWSSGCHKGLWTAESKALYVTLPLYLLGGLIALFVHWKNNYNEGPMIRDPFVTDNEPHYLWGDMKSYAGLVLDGFLLPQILFNLIFNSKEKALAPSFYVGMSVVRSFPHAYDLYRSHYYGRYLDASYIYASHGVDFYSTAWNIIIPCGGMLFAIIIYKQQRCGGRCILPLKFRESISYEKVPVVSG